MLNAYHAHIVDNGLIGLSEPMPSWVNASTKVVVLFSDSETITRPDEAMSGALFSEKSLALDWLRPEEDEAWAHLQ